jgi:hypothetical protein
MNTNINSKRITHILLSFSLLGLALATSLADAKTIENEMQYSIELDNIKPGIIFDPSIFILNKAESGE